MKSFIVAKRVIKQILADKRSVGLMFIAPIFIIFLLSVVLTSSTTKPSIDLISPPKAFVDAISKDAKVTIAINKSAAEENLRKGKTSAYVEFLSNVPQITIEGSDPTISMMVPALVKKAALEIMPALPGSQITSLQPVISYYYGSKDMSMFDSLAPLFMGFFIFFFVFLIAGISFLRERISGTLDRILATPLKRFEIVMGYFLGFGIFVAVQALFIQSFMLFVLNVTMKGSFWLVLLINLILAGQSLALGTLLSAYARNEFQLFQFIPIVIVPQTLFSGILDISEAPIWLKSFSQLFPLTYGARALRDVMIRGKGFSDIFFELFILTSYAILFLILNSIALKKYRKI